MTVTKRKKVTRQRGSRTHGWGLQHRGKGQKGGAGRSGTGKKSGTNLPSIWKTGKLGRKGFISKSRSKHSLVISVKDIEDRLKNWVDQKKVTVEKGVYIVNLKSLGYNKLLSNGKSNKKINVTVAFASKKAVEKIKSSGGEVQIIGA